MPMKDSLEEMHYSLWRLITKKWEAMKVDVLNA